MKGSTRNDNGTIIILTSLVYFFCFGISVAERRLIADEIFHANQIRLFIDMNWTIHPVIPMIPTYHLIIATAARVLAQGSDGSLRILSFLLSSPTPFLFLLLRKSISRENISLRSLQLLWFPLVLPLFFHLYTDIPTLAAILAMILAVEHRKWSLASALGCLAILLRQTSVVWVLFAFLKGYLTDQTDHQSSVASFIGWLRKRIILLLPFAAFVLFVVWANGLILGAHQLHGSYGVRAGNLLFFSCLFTFLLPHVVISQGALSVEFWKKHPWILSSVLIGYGFAIGSMAPSSPPTFTPGLLHVQFEFFVTNSLLGRVGYFLSAVIGTLTLIPVFSAGKIERLIIPFLALSLAPMSLTEPRYSIVPFTIVLLFLPPMNAKVELSALVLYMLLSIVLLYTFLAYPAFL